MPSFRRVAAYLSVILTLLSTAEGCRSTSAERVGIHANPAPSRHVARAVPSDSDGRHDEVLTVSHSPIDAGLSSQRIDPDDPFQGQGSLDLDALISVVESRNPTLTAVQSAWAAAAQKYPQAIAFDDPMLQTMFAPQSFSSSSNVPSSYYVGIAQRVPWAGKRGLRGQQADWEASAAGFDVGETKLRLAEASRVAFFEFYLNARMIELQNKNLVATTEYRDIAKSKYESNQVTQQDMLQAEVELNLLEQRLIELEQERQIAVARINTLLHRRPDHPLPQPPAELLPLGSMLAAETLRDVAVSQRPELQAMESRLQAEQTSVQLACKEFYPDFEFMGRYDRFWIDREQRPQVGMNMNIPLNRSKRQAAVDEAIFRVQKMQAELDQAIDNVRNDVEVSYARVHAGARTVDLYQSKILPSAFQNVDAAKAGYTAGTVDFLRLIDAQRETISLQEKYQTAIADQHRRMAELERAVGGPVTETVDVPSP